MRFQYMVKLFSIAPKASPLNREKHQALSHPGSHGRRGAVFASAFGEAPVTASRLALCRHFECLTNIV